jgi:hypothetical protein
MNGATDYSELVFALVYATGTATAGVKSHIKERLDVYGYATQEVKLSDLLPMIPPQGGTQDDDQYRHIKSRMDKGNEVRKLSKKNDLLALAAVAHINKRRPTSNTDPAPRKRTAYLLSSLKRAEEARTLQRIYGQGFYLIRVYSPEDVRIAELALKGIKTELAKELIERDQNEEVSYGQRTRDTFYLSDVFITQSDPNNRLIRFLDLVFGNATHTPTQDEHAMFVAYASSFRSWRGYYIKGRRDFHWLQRGAQTGRRALLASGRHGR